MKFRKILTRHESYIFKYGNNSFPLSTSFLREIKNPQTNIIINHIANLIPAGFKIELPLISNSYKYLISLHCGLEVKFIRAISYDQAYVTHYIFSYLASTVLTLASLEDLISFKEEVDKLNLEEEK